VFGGRNELVSDLRRVLAEITQSRSELHKVLGENGENHKRDRTIWPAAEWPGFEIRGVVIWRAQVDSYTTSLLLPDIFTTSLLNFTSPLKFRIRYHSRLSIFEGFKEHLHPTKHAI
jgi:hypothetical protein